MNAAVRAARRAAVGLIRAYQATRRGRLSPCRFVPSCSDYAVEAVDTHGVLHGGALAVWRVARCNPIGGRGFDPVPPRSARRHRHGDELRQMAAR